MKTNIKTVSIILGIMCFLLSLGICVQIKTVNDSGTAVAKTTEENELRDSVLEMKEKYENTYNDLQKKEAELDTLISSATANDSESLSLSEELSNMNSILGLTELQGPGVIITVSDGEVPNNALDASNYIVHDETLRLLVNYLFNGGAEAISINGERIVTSTAITCVGSTIKVNDETIVSPYEIKAMGLSEKIYGAMTIQYGYLYNLSALGVDVEIEKSDMFTIEAYDGIYKFDYAINVQE